MTYERIDDSDRFDGKIRESHELRYRIAAGFVEPNDCVLDAGCGTGYGKAILRASMYVGLDKNPPTFDGGPFYKADFEGGTDFDNLPMFDVFVGLEIIEHLNDAGVNRFVEIAHRATKWIVISTPIVPNSNPFHKQQFTEYAINQLFAGALNPGWKWYGQVVQENRYGIFIFKRQ